MYKLLAGITNLTISDKNKTIEDVYLAVEYSNSQATKEILNNYIYSEINTPTHVSQHKTLCLIQFLEEKRITLSKKNVSLADVVLFTKKALMIHTGLLRDCGEIVSQTFIKHFHKIFPDYREMHRKATYRKPTYKIGNRKYCVYNAQDDGGQLGNGAYGRVRQSKNITQTRFSKTTRELAVKKMYISGCDTADTFDSYFKVVHEFIQLHEEGMGLDAFHYKRKRAPHISACQIHMPRLGETVSTVLKKSIKEKNRDETRKCLSLFAKALTEFHQKGKRHGDIKLDNAMIDPASGEVRLIDFATTSLENGYGFEPEMVRSTYPSPLLLQLISNNQKGKITKNPFSVIVDKEDVFSFGLSVLSTLNKRFNGCFSTEIIPIVRTLNGHASSNTVTSRPIAFYYQFVRNELDNSNHQIKTYLEEIQENYPLITGILKDCLNLDPVKRPSAQELLTRLDATTEN